jgi:excisionase family DNA binding protein
MRKENHNKATQTSPPNSTKQGTLIRHQLGNVYFYTETPPNNETPKALPVKITRKTYNAVFQGYPDVLDVRQVSELLNVSCKTVYRLLNEGALASLKVGRAFKIPKLYLLQYIKVLEHTQAES